MAEHSGISVSKKSNESSHRRRRPQAGPSSGLLSILATIAASSSTTDGKPLISERSPPQFLCPSVQYDSNIPSDSVLIYRPKNSPPQTITGLSASPDGRNIPDKYIQGNDGRWRKAEYTLYGSTLCQPPQVPPAPAVDQPAPPSPPKTSQFLDSLPNGWKPNHKASSHTSTIVGLSVGLALFICFFIMGCIFWRKNKVRKKDEEQKVRKRRQEELRDDWENLVEKDARVKQKVWARATARWKARARYSAQQRRGKRAGHRSLLLAQSSAILIGDTQSTTTSSIFPTRPSSRGPPQSTHETSISPGVSSPPTHRSQIFDIPTSAACSPPAYHPQDSRIPSIVVSSSDLPTDCGSLDVSDSYYFRRSSRSFTHGFPHSSSSDDHTPYVPPYDGAHIAIDDKRFLASLAGLASAPPLDHSDMSGTTEPSQVSAPEWHDEELDFAGTSHRHSLSSSTSVHHPHPPVLQFPPPPQFQGELTATALYHYSSSFENLVSDHEPSAPSFDAGLPSAPPLEETNIGPSAPPLPDDWDWERDGDGRVQKHQNINLEDDVTAAQQSNFSRASDTMPRADGPSRK